MEGEFLIPFFSMNLIERARKNINRIITNSTTGPGQNIVLTSPDGIVLETIGLHKKIRLGVDMEGNIVNSKVATVTISNEELVKANYPFRDANNEVQLEGHRIDVADVTGLTCNYIMQSWHPDETLGLIVCYVQDYQ